MSHAYQSLLQPIFDNLLDTNVYYNSDIFDLVKSALWKFDLASMKNVPLYFKNNYAHSTRKRYRHDK